MIKKLIPVILFLSLALTSGMYLIGCEGSDTHKAIDTTVEGLSGKNAVEKGEKMKQQINKLESDAIEKIQQSIKNGTYGEQEQKEEK